MDTNNLIHKYINNHDWRIKENSNQDYSYQGMRQYITNHVLSNFWLTELYPPHIADAHRNGDLHLHDLGELSTYCCGWDLQDILMRGFRGEGRKSESAPAKHFRVALGQLCNFFYTLQGEAAGAQAVSSFDTLLAPFIRYDGLDYPQVKQAMQEFIFNMNVPTRVGFQAPFTNLSFDLQPPSTYADQPVIIGGELQTETYGDFQTEMDMVNRAFAEVMLEGDAKGRVFTFPIPTYSITKDFAWDNPQLIPLWQMTAKYGIPYFSNFVNSDMKPEDARSMCCRLRLSLNELRKRGGGLFGSNPLTGSVGVVTVNLPAIGATAEDRLDWFWRIEAAIELAAESLEIKRAKIEEYTELGLYPYSRFYLSGVKESQGTYWANHFSTIGLIGMHEACLNFLGVGIETEQGRELALDTLRFMNETILDIQVRTGHLFNLEATPGEGTSYRLAKTDRPQGVKTSGTDDAPYYTNSTHLPVNYTDDIFEALEHQDELQAMYTGGTVLHLYLGEQIQWQAARDLVRKVTDNYKLPYISLTPTFSICPVHKYLTGNQETCPHCGAECEVYSRVVGYLRPVQGWNTGKQQEFKDRNVYKNNT